MTTFGSVCSGIEAASVAWHPLGWRAAWLAEIEPFPCAVLAHHYPDVPNLGNMLLIPAMLRNGDIPAPDVFCGGTPCQAFSVAGLRNSLKDARGNLSLTFCEIADEIDIQRTANGLLPCIIKWENVPGVLNTKDNAFGCFLGALAGEDCALVAPGGKWANAGCVFGPQRTVAWRVFDAQFFGVAQRRRRVFVVASARKGFDPTSILFEPEGVRRDSAPSRQAGQDVTGTISARTSGGGGLGTDFELGGGFNQLAPKSDDLIEGGQLARCLTTKTRIDAETETLIPTFGGVFSYASDVCPTLRAGGNSTGGDRPPGTDVDTADSLIVVNQANGPLNFVCRDCGWDNLCSPSPVCEGCGEDQSDVLVFHIDAKTVLGGDKPHVLGPVAFMADDYKNGTFEQCDTARPLTTSADRTRAAPILAFSCKDYGADAAIELAPTMRAMGHSGSHANAGGQLAVCVTGDITHTLKAEGFDASEDGTGRGQPIVAHAIQAGALRENPAGGPDGMGVQADVAYTLEARSEVQCAQMGMAVRRLTPKECARLQGFPDNHLSQVMVRGKPAADGPMYKAFGNSWAIPCVFWIGARIDKALRGLK